MTDWAISVTPPRWRRWLLAETPHSRVQARLSRAYLSWVAYARNPLAMLGLVIIDILIFLAVFAPWVAPHSPIAGSLADRLMPEHIVEKKTYYTVFAALMVLLAATAGIAYVPHPVHGIPSAAAQRIRDALKERLDPAGVLV